MKRIIEFGKIDYLGTGHKNCPVVIDIELRVKGGEKTFTIDPQTKERIYTGNTTPTYHEFSVCGTVYNHRKTDCYLAGQCLDEISKYINDPLFKEIYCLWEKYHLNSMHAGTPAQEKAIKEWKKKGNKYDYSKVCEYLKSINLYEVKYTGLSVGKVYNNELYKYGHGWIVEEIPTSALNAIVEILED
jgi:hypothetical protein